GIVPSGLGVFLDFSDAIKRLGVDVVKARYGELFPMYQNITNEDPLKTPMKIYPAVHYTMGGLWVDYELMTSVKGLYCTGEANFSDHGANRLGASALMQGLSDGYFVLPATISNYLAGEIFTKPIPTDHPAFIEAAKGARSREEKLLSIKGKRTVDDFHKALGKIMWEYCGMARTAEGLTKARTLIQQLRKEFWEDVNIPGQIEDFNPELDKANRVADFIELGELMVIDALNRNESCGGHFRTEYQDAGEAKRDDANYAYVAAWQHTSVDTDPVLHKENLVYENIEMQVRSYK
ncbi:MAG TPA: FAD-binding protein, partial [Cyclobacteriaceae bacterium]|nr:FAD-binding protein [Cyclobacteriaceae bacterium]